MLFLFFHFEIDIIEGQKDRLRVNLFNKTPEPNVEVIVLAHFLLAKFASDENLKSIDPLSFRICMNQTQIVESVNWLVENEFFSLENGTFVIPTSRSLVVAYDSLLKENSNWFFASRKMTFSNQN